RLIMAPTAEPVSIDVLKDHLKVDHNDEDELLMTYLKSAREWAEGYTRRALLTQTLEMVLDDFPLTFSLALMRPPLQSVTSVKYYDKDNVEATWTDYEVDARSEPGQIHFNSMPGTALLESGGVVVRYVAGYGNDPALVPSPIVQGILMTVAHRYENRETINVGNIVTE